MKNETIGIKHNGDSFIPINELKYLYGWGKLWEYSNDINIVFNVFSLEYACVIKLFEWHFDVFGLIEQNLAIDINNM